MMLSNTTQVGDGMSLLRDAAGCERQVGDGMACCKEQQVM